MDKELIRKVLYNKKNNQLSITLPRKILGIDKKKIPKKVLLKIKELKFLD